MIYCLIFSIIHWIGHSIRGRYQYHIYTIYNIYIYIDKYVPSNVCRYSTRYIKYTQYLDKPWQMSDIVLVTNRVYTRAQDKSLPSFEITLHSVSIWCFHKMNETQNLFTSTDQHYKHTKWQHVSLQKTRNTYFCLPNSCTMSAVILRRSPWCTKAIKDNGYA